MRDLIAHYSGNLALNYERDRRSSFVKQLKWNREFKRLSSLFKGLQRDSSILDAPCGTCRFFSLAKNHFDYYGCDISLDMIKGASASISRVVGNLCAGRIGELPYKDLQFDYVLCMRFLNLVPVEQGLIALKDLCRVTRRSLIVQVRFADSLFNSLLAAYGAVRGLASCLRCISPRRQHGLTEAEPKSTPAQLSLYRKDEFESFLNLLGFRVVKYIPVISRFDSQYLCVIDRNGKSDL